MKKPLVTTRRYRETLKKEMQTVKTDEKPPEEVNTDDYKFVEGKTEIKHLYDVGRSLHTEFDPKNGRERFYSMKHGYAHEKRRGNVRTASQDIGDGAWDYNYKKPDFSAPSQVKNFFDHSHLDVAGF